MNSRHFFYFLPLLFTTSLTADVFSENPLAGTTSPKINNEFMTIDLISAQNLHTGTDVEAVNGDNVMPPIPSGSQYKVLRIQPDNVWILADTKQNGNYAAYMALHICPNPNLQVNSWYGSTTALGKVCNLSHLHNEIFLSSDATLDNGDLVNPMVQGFSNGGSWVTDTTDPTCDNSTWHLNGVGNDGILQIWIHDAKNAAPGLYNGIYATNLYIDGELIDSFNFGRMRNKAGTYPPDAAEYYYCTTCVPAGNNSPNVLQYKMVWPQTVGSHEWHVTFWDTAIRAKATDPAYGLPPSEGPKGQMGGEIRDGKAYLTWRIDTSDLGKYGIQSFDVWQAGTSAGGFMPVNTSPIVANVDRSDYQFLANLPQNWDTVWYKLTGNNTAGATYELASQSFGVPLLTGLTTSPNPSNGPVNIQLTLTSEDEGQVTIFDASGRKIRTIHQGKFPQGRFALTWDGKTDHGTRATPGMYLLRVITKRTPELRAKRIILTGNQR